MSKIEDEIAEDMKEARERKLRREKMFFKLLSVMGTSAICAGVLGALFAMVIWGTRGDTCKESICKDAVYIDLSGQIYCTHSAQTMSVFFDKKGERNVLCACNHNVDGGTP
jgi:hypothetical protein